MSAQATPAVNRKLLIALGAIAALALLFVLVINPLLFAGEPEPLAVGGPPREPAPAAEATEEPAPEPEPVPETFEVFNARDPFQQLVTAPEPVAETDATGAADGDGSEAAAEGDGDQAPVDGEALADGQDDATQDDTKASSSEDAPREAQVGATTIRLRDVVDDDDHDRVAVVEVNGSGYRAGEGQVFAERFRVLDLSGDCATFLFGDSRFTLCKGEEIRK